MEQSELNILIEQCKRGDRNVLRKLVEEYLNMVFSLCLKMLCNEEEIKDAIQNTFVTVWENLERYDAGKGRFAIGVYTIASRICLNDLRHRKKLLSLPDDETVLRQYVSGRNGEQQLMNREWASIVKVLATDLSPKQHFVFTLSMLENRDYSETEAITGLSADKIKNNMYVTRQKNNLND